MNNLSQLQPVMQAPKQVENNGVLTKNSAKFSNRQQLSLKKKKTINHPSKKIIPISVAKGNNKPVRPNVETIERQPEKISTKMPGDENFPNQISQKFEKIPGLFNDSSQISVPDNQPTKELFSAPPPPPKSRIPRVALLLPLSGPHAPLGNALLNAAQLAMFHFADKEFELLPQDTMGTPAGAVDAAALAVGDGASLILGPVFSSSVTAITPAAYAANVAVIAFSNDRHATSNNVFTMGFLPGEEVERVIHFAYKKGLRRFALLAPDNTYGKRVITALNGIAAKLSAEVTVTALYDPNTDDFGPLSPNATIVRNLANYDLRRQTLLDQRKGLKSREDEVAKQTLKRLENLQTFGELPFDALMIADGGKRLQAIAALLPYYDIDPKKTRMLGTGLWDWQGFTSEPALVGGWFAAPPSKERQIFIKNYKEMFGSSPPRLATLSYDATALAAVFVKPDGRFDSSEIMTSQGFGGRDGIFRFTAKGYAQRGLSIYQVLERSAKVIEAAPASFNHLTN